MLLLVVSLLLLVPCGGWKITHTGVNGMVWECGATRLLVDPLLVGDLTFLELGSV